MRIIAVERELVAGSDDSFRSFAVDEAKALYALYKSGVVRETYFRADKNEAVLILEVADTDDATEKLSTLPFVSNELIAFDLIPLRPYPGFERLFAVS